jgi:hypothetical protein
MTHRYDRNGYRIDDEPTQAQLLRRRSQPPPRKAGQMSWDEFQAWAAANNKPTRPIGFFENQIELTKSDKPYRNPMGQVEK